MISNKIVYDMVCQIPEGKIATYGQMAKLTGYPKHARQVGYALAALDSTSQIPWHRVVNSKGSISPRGAEGYDDYQRILLEEENVVFNDKGCIDLKKYQWQSNDLVSNKVKKN